MASCHFQIVTLTKHQALKSFMLQGSDWEEVNAEDVEGDKDLLYSAGATSFSRPSSEHLEAMAKVFNEVSSSCMFEEFHHNTYFPKISQQDCLMIYIYIYIFFLLGRIKTTVMKMT